MQNLQLQTQRIDHFNHRVITRLSASAQRLVQTLATQIGIFGQLAKAAGDGYVFDCHQKYIRVRICDSSRQIGGGGFVVVQVVGGVKRCCFNIDNLARFGLAVPERFVTNSFASHFSTLSIGSV